MKYLVIGSGGVGGAVAAYMHKGGLDVSLLLRGKRYDDITKNGLRFTEAQTELLPIRTVCTENIGTGYDAVIIAVKDYDLRSVCEQYRDRLTNALVVPMMNGLSGGRICSELLGESTVMDSCVYLTAGKAADGGIAKIPGGFKIVFEDITDPRGRVLASNMESCGIKVKVTDKIAADKFLKFFFISPLSLCQAYFGSDCGGIVSDPEKTAYFKELSAELFACGRSMGLELPENCVEKNLERLSKMPSGYYSSMAKDYLSGHTYERTIMLEDVVSMAEKSGIDAKKYKELRQKLKQF